MSKDALALLKEMGVPAQAIVAECAAFVKRATHMQGKKAVGPSEDQIAAYVSEQVNAAHMGSVRAWIVATLTKAV